MVVFSVCALDGDKRPTISHNPEAQKATPSVCEKRDSLSAPLAWLMTAVQVKLHKKTFFLKLQNTFKTDFKKTIKLPFFHDDISQFYLLQLTTCTPRCGCFPPLPYNLF